MSDDFSTENEIIIPADLQNQTESGNELNDKITELSKKGYQLLKEDKIEEATQAFESILELEKNNNYALVGLGDTERKKNNLKKAIEYLSNLGLDNVHEHSKGLAKYVVESVGSTPSSFATSQSTR